MNRVVVIGQARLPGRLCLLEFARTLSVRLGVRHWALAADAGDAPAPLADEVARALSTHEQWIVAEPAGRFSEAVFRRADTVVWLHYSPWDVIRDMAGRVGDAMPQAAPSAAAAVPRAGLQDVRDAFSLLMQAPSMYRLLEHPALAHLSVHELRSPRQATFWLMSQRRRSGLRSGPPAQAAVGA